MNILFLYHKPLVTYLGGVEQVTKLLSREFKSHGHNVSFLYTCATEKAHPDQMEPAYFIEEGDKEKINKFNDLIKSKNIDVIINQSWTYDTSKFLKSLGKISVKVISCVHNQPFPAFKRERLMKKYTYPTTFRGKLIKVLTLLFPHIYRSSMGKFQREIFSNFEEVSDKIYLLSDKFFPRVLEILPAINREKLDAVNNPNTFEIKENLRNNKENLVLFVGRLEDPQKNVKAFIDVWDEFYKTHPDWKAIIVGDGAHRKIFEKYAKKKKTRNLEFAGNQKNVDPFYSKAKFLCMTSNYEGWGMVLPEAMAYNCIPLVFNSYEAAEDVIPLQNKFLLIEPNNIKMMAQRMSQLDTDEALLNQIRENNRDHIKNFKADKIAAIWLNKLTRLLN